jgi:hypothetical protein
MTRRVARPLEGRRDACYLGAMNSPEHKPITAKENDPSRPAGAPPIRPDGLGLPHLSTDAARRADDSSLEPDQSVDLDDTIEKEKETADENASSSPGS